jgi:acyl-CoA synthetase (AMP-forming)/AMP-acid ligase II
MSFNYADYLPQLAQTRGELTAITVCATGETMSFVELSARTDAYARGFQKIGIEPGMRTVLMVRPGINFLPLTFALFKIGAVPVLIDPGMGRGNLLGCVAQVQPEAFVGIPLAHLVRLVFRKYFRGIRIFVTIGRKFLWGGYDLGDIFVRDELPAIVDTAREDPAAIIFTTGSTGRPKGVLYTHGMFDAQRQVLYDVLNVKDGDVDMPGFALFALFTLTMGMPVVLPEMDPTRPADVDPEKIIDTVNKHKITFSFGSPALWNRVSAHCIDNNIKLPGLQRVVMAGAPVPAYLHERLLDHILPAGADTYTPYGATECLPVTMFQGTRVLAETAEATAKGRGVCVGAPLPGVQMKVLPISDGIVPRLAGVEMAPPGEIGEIIVQAPMVSRAYFDLPEQTALHKIYETDERDNGPFWHRIGDVGYVDELGRLWFCGRKAHRVETGTESLYTVCCEAIYNNHPQVFRSALVGAGNTRYNQTPVIIIEPEPGQFPESEDERVRFAAELHQLGQASDVTKSIDRYLFNKRFPVDIRHNAKIFREQLAIWATEEINRAWR